MICIIIFDVFHNNIMSKIVEDVLILQGGGLLGAFGCGIYKSLGRK
jgi:hypothetical protein